MADSSFDRNVVRVVGWKGQRNRMLDGGPAPHGKGQTYGEIGRVGINTTLAVNRSSNLLDGEWRGPRVSHIRWTCTLAPLDEYG